MPIQATEHTNGVVNNYQVSEVTPSQIETPSITTNNGQPIRTKLRAYSVTAGQDAYLDFLFQDEQGSPYNLSELPTGCTFSGVIQEKVSGVPINLKHIEIKDAPSGMLSIHLTAEETRIPAVYDLTVQCLLNADSVLRDNHAYLYITRSLAKAGFSGPPDLMELRLQLHDSSPEENKLLDGLTFSDDEIALAVSRPVLYFNEMRPDVGVYYNTSNFPYRYHWVEGAIGQLYRIAAELHRKNSFQYSAGGTTVNDFSKEQTYMQMAQNHWQTFVDFAKREKVKINVDNGWRSVSSLIGYW